jgi:hypothetical protein
VEKLLPTGEPGMIGKSNPAGLWLSILGDGFLEAAREHCDELMD